MPRGSSRKHSKQAGTHGSEAFTHAERKALGYGVVRERLGKETVKDFHACALTLRETDDAVCTRAGVVYDRGAIVESLATQRLEQERKLRKWEREEAGKTAAEEERAKKRRRDAAEAFHAENHAGVRLEKSGDDDDSKTYSGATSTQAMELNKRRTEGLDGFWKMDGGVRDDLTHECKKPDLETKCPTTLEKLRMKDLVPIKWTKVRVGESGRYMCPVTFKTLTNTTSIVVLKPTGDALSEEGYKLAVEKEGSYNGVKIRKDKDVIRLQKGGSGFSASGTQVESKAEFALGLAGGAELRGQNRGGGSKFGLRFSN